MAAVWMRVRAELRGRWRSLLAVALVAGLAGAAVLGAAMGARRTHTAYPRLLEASNAHDVLLGGASFETLTSGYYDAVAALPEVEDGGVALGVALEFVEPAVPPEVLALGLTLASLGEVGETIDRPKVIAGRLADPEATDEITINKILAETTGVKAGDRIVVRQLGEERAGPPFTLTVAGVTVTSTDVIPIANLDSAPAALLLPAATEAHIDPLGRGFEGQMLTLRPGTDVAAFERKVRLLLDDYPVVGDVFFASEEGRAAVVARAVRPQVMALTAFAILTGLTMLLVIGQTLARQIWLDAVENPTLAALGMSHSQLFLVGLLRVLIAASGAATTAVVVAIAGSPLTPIGPARLAEPSPGVEVNVAMLGVGAAAIVVALVAATVVAVWRAARARDRAERIARPSALAGLMARLGGRPSVTVGVRFALEPGRGRTAVPVRTTLIGTVVALAAVVGAFTFGASLVRLVETPRLYGQDWDILSDMQFGTIPASLVETVKTDAGVEAAAGGVYGVLRVGDRLVPALGLDQLRGSLFPTLIEGRAPEGPTEIALGTTSLRTIGARVGDSVSVRGDEGDRAMRIVGRAVFPRLGQGSFTPTALGEGAAVTTEVLGGVDVEEGGYTFILIRTTGAGSASLNQGLRTARLASELAQTCELAGARGNLCAPDQRPAEIENYRQVRGTPYVLTGILAALAMATLAHALVTSVSRRRRDLAVLKTLGFGRAQVWETVAWQATTLALLGLVMGIPIGIALGRWGWGAFASHVGVVPAIAVPVGLIAAAAAGMLVLANIIAGLPGRAAARTQPAVVLRTE